MQLSQPHTLVAIAAADKPLLSNEMITTVIAIGVVVALVIVLVAITAACLRKVLQ